MAFPGCLPVALRLQSYQTASRIASNQLTPGARVQPVANDFGADTPDYAFPDINVKGARSIGARGLLRHFYPKTAGAGVDLFSGTGELAQKK